MMSMFFSIMGRWPELDGINLHCIVLFCIVLYSKWRLNVGHIEFINAHFFLIFQSILMILVSKFMVYRALSDKEYLL